MPTRAVDGAGIVLLPVGIGLSLWEWSLVPFGIVVMALWLTRAR